MSESDDDELWKANWEFRIGTFSSAYWAAVVEMQLQRLERGADAHRARRLHPARTSESDRFAEAMTHTGPINADGFFLILAIERLLVLAKLYERRYDASRVQDAVRRFRRKAPDVKSLRDALTHLDEYATGGGRRPDFAARGHWWPGVGIDDARGEFDLRLGVLHVELRRATRAAIELAKALDGARGWITRR
jgi:hypothetical protein